MRILSVITLAAMIGVGGIVAWSNLTEHFTAKLLTVAGSLICLLLIVFWLICKFGGSVKTKVVTIAVGVLALAGSTKLFRYEGSLDGSSVPNYVWRWAPEKGAGMDSLSNLAVPAESFAESWKPEAFYRAAPKFLGDERTGAIKGFRLNPDWDANPPKERWRRQIGLGWSGFAVSGPYAVTQEQRDEIELVTCYHLETGEPLWAHRNEARFEEGMGGNGPRATPQIDGAQVYALGATGILDCLNLANGTVRWTRNVLAENETKNPMYGKSGAPLVTEKHVIVTGGDSGPLLLAYDKMTGEPAWTSGEGAAGYASPVIFDVSGKRQIVSVNGKSVTGHAVEQGDQLWKWDWSGTFPRPGQPQLIGDDRILVTASYGLGSHLLKISPEFAVEHVWESNRMKTKFSSTCIKDGYAYGLDEGRLACISLEDGSRQWKDGRYGFGQNILVGDVLLVQAERGRVVLVETNPEELREIASIQALSDDNKTWNVPTLAGSYLLVRNDSEVACYNVPVIAEEEIEQVLP